MSPEAQRIAIAEACPRIANDLDDEGDNWIWQDCDGVWHECHDNDPLADLNAMHEAEKVLTDSQHKKFRFELRFKTGIGASCTEELDCDNRAYISATAAHRAEAFLRTLNLWKEAADV